MLTVHYWTRSGYGAQSVQSAAVPLDPTTPKPLIKDYIREMIDRNCQAIHKVEVHHDA